MVRISIARFCVPLPRTRAPTAALGRSFKVLEVPALSFHFLFLLPLPVVLILPEARPFYGGLITLASSFRSRTLTWKTYVNPASFRTTLTRFGFISVRTFPGCGCLSPFVVVAEITGRSSVFLPALPAHRNTDQPVHAPNILVPIQFVRGRKPAVLPALAQSHLLVPNA